MTSGGHRRRGKERGTGACWSVGCMGPWVAAWTGCGVGHWRLQGAVQPGHTPWWLPRWRSMRRPCASATKASRGGRVVRDGGQAGVGKRGAWVRSMATQGEIDELLQVRVHDAASTPFPCHNDGGKGVYR